MKMNRRGLFSLLGKIGLGLPAAVVLSNEEASARRFLGVKPMVDDDARYVSAGLVYRTIEVDATACESLASTFGRKR